MFSPTRPSGPSWSSSHKVCVSVYLFIYVFPSNAIFIEASHWPSGHMIRSRPLIGQGQGKHFHEHIHSPYFLTLLFDQGPHLYGHSQVPVLQKKLSKLDQRVNCQIA